MRLHYIEKCALMNFYVWKNVSRLLLFEEKSICCNNAAANIEIVAVIPHLEAVTVEPHPRCGNTPGAIPTTTLKKPLCHASTKEVAGTKLFVL